VTTIGTAALDAAEQARRAAGIAVRAAATALDAQRRVTNPDLVTDGEDDSLRNFTERADRIAQRLRKLERVPISAPERIGKSQF